MRMSRLEIAKKLLADPVHKEIFSGPHREDIYLVGGYIRDLFLKRAGPDRDYIVPGDLQFIVSDITRRLKGRIVNIGKWGLARVIMKNGSTFDFTPAKGYIREDLSQRDFTINSLAWNPYVGLIDVYNGVGDIRSGKIRMISEANLLKDPIRILRAYRFASELGFGIESQTRSSLKSLKRMLLQTKSERITSELFRILMSERVTETLGEIAESSIGSIILPYKSNELNIRLKVISKTLRIIKNLPLIYRRRLQEVFAQDLTCAGVVILEILIQYRRTGLLCIGKKIGDRLEKIDKASEFRGRLNQSRGLKKLAVLFELFSLLQDASMDFLIINNMARYIPHLRNFEKIKKKGLISSKEIMKISGMGEGREIGIIIGAVKKAQFTGEIASRADAVKCVRSLI